MKENVYKLGEYKIIESEAGELRWESHFGLGALQEGRCFRKGSILFMGPAERRGDGFLKLEFVDHLEEFPEWSKTKYYCENLHVFHCKTGKRVTREEMRMWVFDRGREGKPPDFSGRPNGGPKGASPLISRENVDFRLQACEINRRPNGQIVWKAYEGLSSLRTGTCTILEDILFLGPWHDVQTRLPRRQFLANLKQLPDWNQTRYYCPRPSLRDCKPANRVTEKRKVWNRGRSVRGPHDIDNGSKNITEFMIPEGAQRGIPSGRIWPVFDSLADSARNYCEKGARVFRSKFRRPYGKEGFAVFRLSGIGKWIMYAVVLMILIISLVFASLIGYWKDHRERRHYEKGEHSSDRHRDH